MPENNCYGSCWMPWRLSEMEVITGVSCGTTTKMASRTRLAKTDVVLVLWFNRGGIFWQERDHEVRNV